MQMLAGRYRGAAGGLRTGTWRSLTGTHGKGTQVIYSFLPRTLGDCTVRHGSASAEMRQQSGSRIIRCGHESGNRAG